MINEKRETILIVENDFRVGRTHQQSLQGGGKTVILAGSIAEASRILGEQDIDVLVLGRRLAQEDCGLSFCNQRKQSGRDLPVIVVTGVRDEEIRIRALKAGVRDIVATSSEWSNDLDYLPEAVERVLAQVRMEKQLAESQARLAAIIGSAKEAIIIAEPDRRISLFNTAAEQMFRCRADQAIGRSITQFIPKEFVPDTYAEINLDDPNEGSMTQFLRSGTRGIRADGEEFPLESSVSRVSVAGKRYYTIVARDVSEKKRAEELHAAKVRCTAVRAEIGDVLARKGTLRVILKRCVDAVVAHLGVAAAQIWTKKENEEALCLYVDSGLRRNEEWRRDRVAIGETTVGRIAERRESLVTNHLAEDDAISHAGWASNLVAFAGYPLVVNDQLVGVLSLYSCDEFHSETTNSLASIADTLAQFIERKRAEEQVIEQAKLLDRATNAIFVFDLQGRIQYWNRGAKDLFGWSAEEASGEHIATLLFDGEGREPIEQAWNTVLKNEQWDGDLRKVRKDGQEVLACSSWTLMRDQSGHPKSVLAIATDITEKKKLERQYLRAQRMESIGKLAGGIAHDLNNVLSPIMMSLEMLNMFLPDHARKSLLEPLQCCAQRGSEMVKQILSFARGLDTQPVMFQLRYLIRDLEKMVKYSFPKSIDIQMDAPKDIWTIHGDATQIYQVFMNLCVNARDAMSEGGALTLTADNVSLDEGAESIHPDAKAGQYVRITVTDTGAGIPDNILHNIFDPFFTTKDQRNGTGLGLSSALGIVKSHGGFINVCSEAGKGTTFFVYLPACKSKEHDSRKISHNGLPQGNGELILVVDDEESVCKIARATLEANSYKVLTASDGSTAVALYEQHGSEIRAVLLDMMMPVMDGNATVSALRQLDPQVQIVKMSGLVPKGGSRDGDSVNKEDFLLKPFSAVELLSAMQRVIEQRNDNGQALSPTQPGIGTNYSLATT